MTPNIRPYAKGDYQRVLDICVAAFAPIHEGFEEQLGRPIFDRRYHAWRQEYADYLGKIPDSDPDTRVYVVENEGEVVGFIYAIMQARYQMGEIGLNAVDPRHQGKGIGKRMYAFVLDDLKKRGAKIAFVGTGADAAHAPARAAYAGVGFDRSIPGIYYFRTL